MYINMYIYRGGRKRKRCQGRQCEFCPALLHSCDVLVGKWRSGTVDDRPTLGFSQRWGTRWFGEKVQAWCVFCVIGSCLPLYERGGGGAIFWPRSCWGIWSTQARAWRALRPILRVRMGPHSVRQFHWTSLNLWGGRCPALLGKIFDIHSHTSIYIYTNLLRKTVDYVCTLQ